jgi:surface antigen
MTAPETTNPRRRNTEDEIMRKTIRSITVVLACCAGIAPAMAQTTPDDLVPASTATCQNITAQAVINGQLQNVSGLACLQSDGTWQLMQNLYPPAQYAYGWYDPWYWGPPIGVGTGFFFFDFDHRRHRLDHVFFRHSEFGPGFHQGGFHNGGFHRGGAGGGFGGGGMHMGGGHR